jgi:nitrite reductase/ring-hydroxylating ferredoxin subunit/uncharacterized membrane protein
MSEDTAVMQFVDQPALDKVAEPLSKAVRGVFERAGAAGFQVKNTLHGVWLGHPLHPALVAVPLGAWTAALALDASAAANADPGLARGADTAIAVGLVGAAASAVTGLTDWSETDGASRRVGLVHGLLNIAATTLYAASYVLRKNGSRASGQSLAVAGFAAASAAGWLGGELVYERRIGVTHAVLDGPEEYTAIAASADVQAGTTKCVRRSEGDVMLTRHGKNVCALANSCSHLGGPLAEGTLKEHSVVCPWHGSEFALKDGHVINGPATHKQPTLRVREENGQVEVKLR